MIFSSCLILCGLLWVISQTCPSPLPRPAPSNVEFVMFVSSEGKTHADSLWDYVHAHSGLRTKLSKEMARKGILGESLSSLNQVTVTVMAKQWGLVTFLVWAVR